MRNYKRQEEKTKRHQTSLEAYTHGTTFQHGAAFTSGRDKQNVISSSKMYTRTGTNRCKLSMKNGVFPG